MSTTELKSRFLFRNNNIAESFVYELSPNGLFVMSNLAIDKVTSKVDEKGR